MSRHRQPEDDSSTDVAVDAPATGSPAEPPTRARVVLVPLQRRASEPVTSVQRDWSAPDEYARARREWADAPGVFTRCGVTGPRTHPMPVVPVPSRPQAPALWGPWPTEQSHPRTPARRGPGVTAAIAVLVVLLLGLGVGLGRPDLFGLTGRTPVAASGEATPGGGAAPAGVAPATGGQPAGVPVDATTELRRLARSDAVALAGVENAWVPELASARPGTVAGGRTVDAAAVLAEHEQLRARHPQARLLWSGDWPVFGRGDHWVTVLATPSRSAAGANAWCDRQGLRADDCFARRLARGGGSAGSAVHR